MTRPHLFFSFMRVWALVRKPRQTVALSFDQSCDRNSFTANSIPWVAPGVRSSGRSGSEPLSVPCTVAVVLAYRLRKGCLDQTKTFRVAAAVRVEVVRPSQGWACGCIEALSRAKIHGCSRSCGVKEVYAVGSDKFCHSWLMALSGASVGHVPLLSEGCGRLRSSWGSRLGHVGCHRGR